MKTILCLSTAAACAALAPAAPAATYTTLTGAAPQVIGHRGAPAYLPENTIGGNELAAEMGSDFVETDVMMTSDGVLIAMHDSSLERTTDVEALFEPRNGGYAASDFTYEEISRLTVEPTGTGAVDHPGFTPMAEAPYRVPTFADMLDALTAYNEANGTNVGMLTEGKYAYDAATNQAVIDTLVAHGYDTPAESAVQSFDFGNVDDYAAILDDLGIGMGIAQLGTGGQVDGEWFVSETESFESLAGYVDTVALGTWTITEDLIAAAHDLGLGVFGWTFRPEDQAAAYDMAQPFLDWGLDGFITDNPDYISAAIASYGTIAPIPVPAALPLLAAGLAAFGGVARARRRRG